MTQEEIKLLLGFYENELKSNILSFWLPRCMDEENGGYFNCYDNAGKHLVSHDKYTWSQGRFVWAFSKLASTSAPIFTKEERARFLDMAKSGADFLKSHVLLGENDWRCSFLLDEAGKPKFMPGATCLDMSIYADCFVVIGLAMYSHASGDEENYQFAKKLYESCLERVKQGTFNTLPYPLSPEYRAHGIPMILSNVTKELLEAANDFDPSYVNTLKSNLDDFTSDIMEHFADSDNVIHEVIRSSDNSFIPQLLGQHANPGHTIEDMWFMADAARILDKKPMEKKLCAIALKALENGWDEEKGGILHYCGVKGGKPEGDIAGVENETMMQQVISGWGDKLWWVHSEALYTTLRCYFLSGDESFLAWHKKVFSYVFEVFPNPDREIREWLQILRKDGKPEDKVVALPVKDPFHITRNLILIIELLDSQLKKR